MANAVSLEEARVFLRIDHGESDEILIVLLEASTARVEALTGEREDWPAPLRLAVLALVARSFDDGVPADMALVAPLIAPWCKVRL